MKDMIKEILDADRRTKDAIESTEKLKLESAKRISEFLEKRKSEYIDKARMNIKVIKKIEDSKAQIDKIKRECQRTLDRIESVYQNLKDEWNDTIFNNIIESNYD